MNRLHDLTCKLLEQILTRNEGECTEGLANVSDHRIRVLFSVDVLAYFFKLLNNVGALDAEPVTQLMVSISKNFVTAGVGDRYISPVSITTKYKQVIQSTARNTRALLLKMLKQLDQEFIVT